METNQGSVQAVDVLSGTVTDGPWRVDGTQINAWHRAGKQVVAECYIETPGGHGGAGDGLPSCNQMKHDAAANATRIVACVNALAGIENPAAVAELIAAARKLEARGFFEPVSCADAATLDDMAAMRAALAACGAKP